MNDHIDVSIIIVSFNTRELTLACLASIHEQAKNVRFEIVVVDNLSGDGSADAIAARFPSVKVIQAGSNLGFACGNNLAAAHVSGEWLLLLNPDTVILDGAIDKFVLFATSHRKASIFGGRTLFPDGSLNPFSCWRRPTPWSLFCIGTGLTSLFRKSDLFNPEAYGGWQRDTVRPVEIVSGCFLLIRRTLWCQLGGFDPAFFMYGEEADLCLRAANLGISCAICPDAEIIHYGGASEKVVSDKFVSLFTSKSMLFSRHWKGRWPRFGTAMLDLWAFTRLLTYGARSPFEASARQKCRTWQEIWSRRAAWRERARHEECNVGPAVSGPRAFPTNGGVPAGKVLNLTFHGIGVPERQLDPGEGQYWIDADQFKQVLDRLRDCRQLCATFDDGNISDLRIAVPELLKRGLSGRFFIIVDRIGARGSLGLGDLKEMIAAGMEIGFHGYHHRQWNAITSDELQHEIRRGREVLEDMLGISIEQAACPFGGYRGGLLRFLARSGFNKIYTSDRGLADRAGWLQPRNTITRVAGTVKFDDCRFWTQRVQVMHQIKLAVKRHR